MRVPRRFALGTLPNSRPNKTFMARSQLLLHHAREAGVPCEPEELELQQELTEYLAKIWQQPGSGMWESRDRTSEIHILGGDGLARPGSGGHEH